jgi:hypothetical protein
MLRPNNGTFAKRDRLIDLTRDFTRPMDPQPGTPILDGDRQRVFVGGSSRVWIMARGRVTDGRVVPMR